MLRWISSWAALCLCLLAAGSAEARSSGSRLSPLLAGRWQPLGAEDATLIEFCPDGRIIMHSDSFDICGSYRVRGNVLNLTLGEEGNTFNEKFTFEFADDHVLLENTDGWVETLLRIE